VNILIIGDAGAHTGFATVVHALGERWAERHQVSVLAVNYLGDPVKTKMALYRANLREPMDIYGYSRVVELLGAVMPDVVFILNDPPLICHLLLDNPFDPDRVLWTGYKGYKPPIVAYIPIDGENYPRLWDVLVERTLRVAMSDYGQRLMPDAARVYHGVDTNIFKPVPKPDAKRELGFPLDSFLIVRVDKNSYRKDYPATWKALRPILRLHPDVLVHFHCLPTSRDGYDLRAFMFNDEDIRDRVTFSPHLTGYHGWSIDKLALLYSAADLFVSTSHGEGFGLTIAEALACGTPVIAQDYSAIPEVVGPGGILVPPGPPMPVPLGHEQRLPDVEKFTYWIDRFYNFSDDRRRELGRLGREHVMKFSWDEAATQFERLFEDALQHTG
jgi:glycosyltransferase involved in cell wall biosynthesis